jgi:hypothetical protein
VGKKQKVGGSSKDPKIAEPERQAPEDSIQNPEDLANDPPPQANTAVFEAMHTEINSAAHQDSPSPKPPSPPKSTDKCPTATDIGNVTFTGSAFKPPEVSRVLAKHSAKEETPSLEKGKAKLDLDDYSSYSASEIHVGYLSRLHTSRDMEARLVNLMKQKYEVCF